MNDQALHTCIRKMQPGATRRNSLHSPSRDVRLAFHMLFSAAQIVRSCFAVASFETHAATRRERVVALSPYITMCGIERRPLKSHKAAWVIIDIPSLDDAAQQVHETSRPAVCLYSVRALSRLERS